MVNAPGRSRKLEKWREVRALSLPMKLDCRHESIAGRAGQRKNDKNAIAGRLERNGRGSDSSRMLWNGIIRRRRKDGNF